MAKVLAIVGIVMALAAVAYSAPQAPAPAASGAPPVIEPIIDWGKCPQLAPSDTQRKQKTEIIKACLDSNPLNTKPDQLTPENIEKHRIKLGECALNKEDWVCIVSLLYQ